MRKNTLLNLFKKSLYLNVLLFLSFTKNAYAQCLGGKCQTVLGDIPTNPSDFTQEIFRKSLMMAGGIAFLLMASGAFKFLTSAGDPQKLQEGTDIIFSAIAGLLLIVFSVFILKIIGSDLLGIFP